MWAPIAAAMAKPIRHLHPIALSSAGAETQAIAAEIGRDFGAYVPPFALHAPAPTILAACWMMWRETIVTSQVERPIKEALAAAISRANACTYCVDAHTAVLHALGDADRADALADPGRTLPHGDPLAALMTWAAATRTPDHPILAQPPFATAAAPEIIGTALAFHYINRMVRIFLVASPLPFEAPRLKAMARRLLRPLVAGMLPKNLAPATSLHWLPDSALPPDLAWAATSPTIAAAFARAAASFDRAAATVLPAEVRALLRRRVGTWRGEDMSLSRRWLEEAVASVPAAEQPSARLALLAALAPHQVDEAIIRDFRAVHPGDDALIAAAAWSSFEAARRIGTWLRA